MTRRTWLVEAVVAVWDLREFQETSRWIRAHPKEAAQAFNKILKGAVTEDVFT